MDINWLSVVLHLVAARFRVPVRLALLATAWLLQAEFGGRPADAGGDESVVLGHAVVDVTVTKSGRKIVEIVVVRV